MKKLFLSVAAIATSLAMMGEGYQVNTLSTKQEGMGHVGTALKLGAESMMFNPAGMAFMDKTLDLSASVTGIFANAQATLPTGETYKTDNDISTPFAVSGAFSILPNLKAGVTINTPYGSGINWGNDWAGSFLSQSVTLQVFNVQPTLAYRILPNLSIGAGLMISWGSVDLNKGLVNPGTLDKVLLSQGTPAAALFGNTAPASINLKGNAAVALGYNVGILWDINDKISLGASYRSKMNMTVESGDATLTYANAVAEQALASLKALDGSNFSASMPAVSVLSLGISYKPIEKLTLAFDAQMSGWSAYDRLEIEFLDENLSAFNQNLIKNYKNSWAFRLGAQYELNNHFDLRAGFIVDTTPVDEAYFNPETPGMTRLEPCVGFSYRPSRHISIDVAFTYITGLARNGSVTYDDLVAKTAYGTAYQQALQAGATPEAALGIANQMAAQLGGLEKSFTAEYDLNAFIPSIGVSYSF